VSFDPQFLPLLAAMVLVSFATRAGGFWLMKFVPASPAVEAALKATPIAVMVGIVAPAAARGSHGEIAALAVIFVAMKVIGNDIAAAILGVATVAIVRFVMS